MSCKDGSCEYDMRMHWQRLEERSLQTLTEEMLVVLEWLYLARELCFQKNCWDLAMQFQKEINRLEKGGKHG